MAERLQSVQNAENARKTFFYVFLAAFSINYFLHLMGRTILPESFIPKIADAIGAQIISLSFAAGTANGMEFAFFEFMLIIFLLSVCSLLMLLAAILRSIYERYSSLYSVLTVATLLNLWLTFSSLNDITGLNQISVSRFNNSPFWIVGLYFSAPAFIFMVIGVFFSSDIRSFGKIVTEISGKKWKEK